MLFQFATILSSPIETFITPSSLSRFSHSLFAEITSLATESRRMALPTPAAAETERKIVASPRAMMPNWRRRIGSRSDEHTYELQSLMRLSYVGLCLNKITL